MEVQAPANQCNSLSDAEYMAMAGAAQEIMFLRQLEEELLHVSKLPPTTLFVDNQPALSVANRSATRMRHILIKFHYIRDCIDQGRIKLEYVATEKMLADLLTKILPKPKTSEFSTAMLSAGPLTEHPERARLTSGQSTRRASPRSRPLSDCAPQANTS